VKFSFPRRRSRALFLVTRWTQLPFSVSVASVLIERVFDGGWLWLGLWLSLKYVELPKQLGYVNDGLGLFVLGEP